MITKLGALTGVPSVLTNPHVLRFRGRPMTLTDEDIQPTATEARALVHEAGLAITESHHWINPQSRNKDWHVDGFELAMALLSEDPDAGTLFKDDVIKQAETWSLYHLSADVSHRATPSIWDRILVCYRVHLL